MIELRGALAVVTGASSGLGRRFCLDLAAAGAKVTGVARRPELLASLEDELGRMAPGSTAVVCDVRDIESWRAVLAEVTTRHGRIDVLINNAGVPEPEPPAAGEDVLASYRDVMDVNYFAAVAGTLAVLPAMLERRSGVVVNVSSDSGRAPGPRDVVYGASKAALSAFTEALSFTAEDRGVHLHVLYPGWVPTAMGSGAIDAGMAMPPRAVRRTEEQVSRLVLAKMGGRKVDIDATKVARLAPVGRALFPSPYRRAVRKAN